jgi:predicted regulator of Ras-like GTPase activity (Roadblock/LC7/MglB family)
MSTELQSLRAIEGVYGSFIVNANGEAIARDLPAVFDDHTLAESGERIVRLWAVLSENAPPEYALIDFAEYSLFVTGLSPRGSLPETSAASCLCVVVPASVNLLALRLASKWVARSIDREPALAASA